MTGNTLSEDLKFAIKKQELLIAADEYIQKSQCASPLSVSRSEILKLNQNYNKSTFQNAHKTRKLQELTLSLEKLTQFSTTEILIKRKYRSVSDLSSAFYAAPHTLGNQIYYTEQLCLFMNSYKALVDKEIEETSKLEYAMSRQKGAANSELFRIQDLKRMTLKFEFISTKVLTSAVRAKNEYLEAAHVLAVTEKDMKNDKRKRSSSLASLKENHKVVQSSLSSLTTAATKKLIQLENNQFEQTVFLEQLKHTSQAQSTRKKAHDYTIGKLNEYSAQMKELKEILLNSSFIDDKEIKSENIVNYWDEMASVENRLQIRFSELVISHSTMLRELETIKSELGSLEGTPHLVSRIAAVKSQVSQLNKANFTFNLARIESRPESKVQVDWINLVEKMCVTTFVLFRHLESSFLQILANLRPQVGKLPDPLDSLVNEHHSVRQVEKKRYSFAEVLLRKRTNFQRVTQNPKLLQTPLPRQIPQERPQNSKIHHMNSLLSSMILTKKYREKLSKMILNSRFLMTFLTADHVRHFLLGIANTNGYDMTAYRNSPELYHYANQHGQKRTADAITKCKHIISSLKFSTNYLKTQLNTQEVNPVTTDSSVQFAVSPRNISSHVSQEKNNKHRFRVIPTKHTLNEPETLQFLETEFKPKFKKSTSLTTLPIINKKVSLLEEYKQLEGNLIQLNRQGRASARALNIHKNTNSDQKPSLLVSSHF